MDKRRTRGRAGTPKLALRSSGQGVAGGLDAALPYECKNGDVNGGGGDSQEWPCYWAKRKSTAEDVTH
jgi:hypothetical protein